MESYTQQRNQLVDTCIVPSIKDRGVIDALRCVPRHLFIPKNQLHNAYIDDALPIGCGQTISQPSLVAMMTEALELTKQCTVLEIGTGSGYQAAILSLLTKHVISIECIPELAEQAKERLRNLGYKNVRVIAGDGKLGYPKSAPYDGILVTAGASELPHALIDQLKEGGRIVIPLGETLSEQRICIGRKTERRMIWVDGSAVVFVPLV